MNINIPRKLIKMGRGGGGAVPRVTKLKVGLYQICVKITYIESDKKKSRNHNAY